VGRRGRLLSVLRQAFRQSHRPGRTAVYAKSDGTPQIADLHDVHKPVTVLAGAILFWFSSGGFTPAWMASGPGIGFTIGSVAALVAFFVGGLGIGPTSAEMGALGGQIAASGNGPTRQQAAKMQTLEKRLSIVERVDFIMLVIAMLTMATARYWSF
jgi:hypothetical protein